MQEKPSKKEDSIILIKILHERPEVQHHIIPKVISEQDKQKMLSINVRY